jgi:hypothetical protein
VLSAFWTSPLDFFSSIRRGSLPCGQRSASYASSISAIALNSASSSVASGYANDDRRSLHGELKLCSLFRDQLRSMNLRMGRCLCDRPFPLVQRSQGAVRIRAPRNPAPEASWSCVRFMRPANDDSRRAEARRRIDETMNGKPAGVLGVALEHAATSRSGTGGVHALILSLWCASPGKCSVLNLPHSIAIACSHARTTHQVKVSPYRDQGRCCVGSTLRS